MTRTGPFRKFRRSAISRVCLLPVLLLGLSCTIVQDDKYCGSDDECSSRLGGPAICDPLGHYCFSNADGTRCGDDTHCRTPDRPLCDQQQKRCVPCVQGPTNEGCGHLTGLPICLQRGDSTTCVECQSNLDCPSTSPICTASSCRKCKEHSECGPLVNCDNTMQCASWVCIGDGDGLAGLGGQCAANGRSAGGRVYYVSGPLATVACNPTGLGTEPTPESAVCTIDQALGLQMQGPRRTYIRLLGATYPPPTMALTGRQIIIGAPRPGDAMAEIRGNQTPLIAVGPGLNLTLDQVTLTQDKPGGKAVDCTTGGKLTMMGNKVYGSTTPGVTGGLAAISLTNCESVLNWNWIGATKRPQGMTDMIPAHGQGVAITDDGTGGPYRLDSNMIVGNIGIGLNLANANTAPILARFNTIADNGRAVNAFGGITCPGPGGNFKISYSIISNNLAITNGGNQLLLAGCQVDHSFLGPTQTPLMGNDTTTTPLIDNTFHLIRKDPMTMAPNPLVDAVDPNKPPIVPPFPAKDVDLHARPFPLGGLLDIGAHELVY